MPRTPSESFEYRPAIPPPLMTYMEQVYADAWTMYRAAGMPFGNSDAGMLIWYVYDPAAQMN